MGRNFNKVFQRLDVFGSTVGFSYNASNVFRTQFGAMVSLLFVAAMLSFFWNSINKFLAKGQVIFSQQQEYNIHPVLLNLNSSNYMFGVQIQQTNFTKTPYYNLTLTACQNILLDNGTTIKIRKPIPLQPCTLNHWQAFSPAPNNITSAFSQNGINDFLCPRLSDAFELQGQFLSQSFKYLKFGISKCQNKTFTSSSTWNYTCLSSTQQAQVKTMENLRFRLAMPNYIVNPGNPKDILTGFLDMLYFSIQPELMYSTADIYFTKHNVKTDQNLLPYEDIEEDNYVVFTQNNFRSQVVVGNYSNMSEFFLRSDFFSIQTKRSFTKADQFISYIGGFAQVFLVLSAIIVQVYNEFAYQVKLANKLYDFDLTANKDASKNKHISTKINSHEIQNGLNDSVVKNSQGLGGSELQITPFNMFNGENGLKHLDDIPKNSLFSHKHNKDDGNNLTSLMTQQHPQFENDQVSLYKQQSLYRIQGNTTVTSAFQIEDQIKTTGRKRLLGGIKNLEDSIRFSPVADNYKMEEGGGGETSRSKKDCVFDELQSPSLLATPKIMDESESIKLKQEKRSRNPQIPMLPSIQRIFYQEGVQKENHKVALNSENNSSIENELHQKSKSQYGIPGKNDMKTNPNESKKAIVMDYITDNSPTDSQNNSPQDTPPTKLLRDKSRATSFFGLHLPPRLVPLDKKEFLEKEIKNILKRAKQISLTFKYFMYRLSCRKMFASENNILVEKACDRVGEDLDILVLLSRIKEVEKIKDILFDRKQQILFNFFPKPVISAKEDQFSLIPNQRSILKRLQNRNDTEKKTKVTKNTLKLNIRMLGVIMKAVKKFKEPLSRKVTTFEQLCDYQKLYDAYEHITSKSSPSALNDKLVNLLGSELKHVFEACKRIGYRQEKVNETINNQIQSSRLIKNNSDEPMQDSITNSQMFIKDKRVSGSPGFQMKKKRPSIQRNLALIKSYRNNSYQQKQELFTRPKKHSQTYSEFQISKNPTESQKQVDIIQINDTQWEDDDDEYENVPETISESKEGTSQQLHIPNTFRMINNVLEGNINRQGQLQTQ